MTKLKTHKGAAKRFKLTGTRIKHKHANKNHNFTNKNQKSKRQLRGTTTVDQTEERRISKLLKLL